MIKKTLILLAFFMAYGIHPMENPFTSPTKNKIYTTNDKDDCGYEIVKRSLAKTRSGDTIIVMAFDITDNELIKVFTEAKKRGVTVKILICQSKFNENIQKKFEENNLEYRVFNASKNRINQQTKRQQILHKKTIAWTYKNSKSAQFRLWTGSRNLTNLPKKEPNKAANEEMMLYDIDPNDFNEEKTNFENYWEISTPKEKLMSLSPSKKELINYDNNPSLLNTPTKPTNLSSNKYNINSSVAKLFKNANNMLKILYYTIDDPQVLEGIETAAKKTKDMEIAINESSIDKQEVRKFFLKLAERYGVNTYVYNADGAIKRGNFAVSNHIKSFLRQQADGKYLQCVSEGNLTKQNNSDLISCRLIPEDKENAQHFLEAFERIKTQSVDIATACKIKGYDIGDNTGVESKKRKTDAELESSKVVKRPLFGSATSNEKKQEQLVKKMQAMVGYVKTSCPLDKLTPKLIAAQLPIIANKINELHQIKQTTEIESTLSDNFQKAYQDASTTLEALQKRLQNTIVID